MARILVIDDDGAVRATTRLVLERDGHSVALAEDGRVGLKTIQSHDFDLLIVDIFMPGMDGLETIGAIRKHKPTLPIIVMSGASFRKGPEPPPDFLWMATKLGANRSIYKPFRAQDISDTVQACLAEAAAQPTTGT
jgi:CheY-like chemotaxis protein